jgi:hypothetical protein
VSETGKDASAAAHGETAAALDDTLVIERGPVPEHIRRALDGDEPGIPLSQRLLRLALGLLLLAILTAGIAIAAGLVPSPLHYLR